jgi:hypothetical protein
MNGLARLILFLLALALAAYLGFVLVPPEEGFELVRRYGQYAVLVGFVVFVGALAMVLRKHLAGARPDARWGFAALWIVLVSVYLVSREPMQFKIVEDEIVLSATAMNMHFKREVQVPNRGYEVAGTYMLLGGFLDKRPIFFPFVLSVVHDLSGYRVENAFYLNAFLTTILLGLVYLLTCQLSSHRAAALVVLLLASVPLLAQNATGGGFELLNLVMVLATLLLSLQYWQKPDGRSLTALAFSTYLLTQTRYESALFVLCVAFVVAGVWIRERRIDLPWLLFLLPGLMIFYLWQMRTFGFHKEFWQLSADTASPFGVDALLGNLANGAVYLFTFERFHSMNPLVSLLGIPALFWFLYRFFRGFGALRHKDAPTFVFGVFVLGILAVLAVVMVYHWGDLTQTTASRLALPLILILAVCGGLLGARLAGRRSAVLALLAAVGLSFYQFSVPASAQHRFTDSHPSLRKALWSLDFLTSLPLGDYLVLAYYPQIYILHRIPAGPLNAAPYRAAQLAFHLDGGSFDEVLVVQELTLDPASGAGIFPEGQDLGTQFETETLAEKVFLPYTLGRISRITRIEPDPAIAHSVPSEPLGWIDNDWSVMGSVSAEARLRWWRNLP